MVFLSFSGYDAAEIDKKMTALVKACRGAFVDFINAENAAVTEMNAKIENQRQQVSESCLSLGLPPYFPALGLTSCQLLQVRRIYRF